MIDRVASKEAFERLSTMRDSNDGFKIAEKDLAIRGPGEFLGTRQAGVPAFQFGNIVRDRKLLELARREAEAQLEMVKSGEDSGKKEELKQLATGWREKRGLLRIG